VGFPPSFKGTPRAVPDRIGRIDLSKSPVRPTATIIVVFSFEVMHHCVLSIDELVDVGHEVGDGDVSAS
jgi:hypothetical protein